MKKQKLPFVQIATVEILSDAVNYVVLKSPGRSFPGIVIQGDSLARLYRGASEVCRLAKETGGAELQAEAGALCQELGERLAFYERVLSAHGIEIPYASPIAPIERAILPDGSRRPRFYHCNRPPECGHLLTRRSHPNLLLAPAAQARAAFCPWRRPRRAPARRARSVPRTACRASLAES